MSFISSNGARKSRKDDHRPARVSGAPNTDLVAKPKTPEQHRAAQKFHSDLAKDYRARRPNNRWYQLAKYHDERARHHKSKAEEMEEDHAEA